MAVHRRAEKERNRSAYQDNKSPEACIDNVGRSHIELSGGTVSFSDRAVSGGWPTNRVEVEHDSSREERRVAEWVGDKRRERRIHERGTISPRREGGVWVVGGADPFSFVVIPRCSC